MNKTTISLILIVITISSFSHFVNIAQSSESQDFDVHEWGVFLKSYYCNDTSILTQPQIMNYTIVAEKPVIYLHSYVNLTNVIVNVSKIRNVTVEPNATIGDNSIQWDIEVENNTVVTPNGTRYPYLFYEGEITYIPTILANVTVDETSATFCIKNIANYSISDVFFIFIHYRYYPDERLYYDEVPAGGKYYPDSPYGITYIHINKLDPYEENTTSVYLKEYAYYNLSELLVSLIEKGLTESEAQEMIDYWEGCWFNLQYYSDTIITRVPSPQANVFYTIPQSIYDQLLPLTITPQPNSTKRVGIFTITDIPVKNNYIYNAPVEASVFPLFEISLAFCLIAVVLFIIWKKLWKLMTIKNILKFFKPNKTKVLLLFTIGLVHAVLTIALLYGELYGFIISILYVIFNFPLFLTPLSLTSFGPYTVLNLSRSAVPLLAHALYWYLLACLIEIPFTTKDKMYRYKIAFYIVLMFLVF